MERMYEDGYTAREIGQRFGVSRQRVSQIIGAQSHWNTRTKRELEACQHVLGKVPDAEIAKELHISRSAVSQFRKARAIVGCPLKNGAGARGERIVAGKLKSLGFSPVRMPSNHPFDISLGDLRLDVKTCTKAKAYTNHCGNSQVRFAVHAGKRRANCDFYVLLVTDLKCPAFFVIPSSAIPKQMEEITFAWPKVSPRGRKCSWRSYQNAWHLLSANAIPVAHPD